MGKDAKIKVGFVYELYAGLFVVFVLGLWISFILLSNTNRRTFYGPLAASCLRWAFGIMEITSLKFKVDRRDEETWLTTFDESNGVTLGETNKYSLLQYSVSQIVLITVAGVTLVVLGAVVSHQRWVWLLGVTLLTELAIRLIVEVVWRKSRLGGKLQRLLKRWGRW